MAERNSSLWKSADGSHKNMSSRYPSNLILPTSQSQFPRKRSRHERDHRPAVRDDLDQGGFKNSRFKFSSNFSIASDSSSSSRHENYYLNTENRLKKAHSRNSMSSGSSEIFAINSSKADVADFVPRKRERHFGYRYLDELSQKESYEIVVEITKVNCPFDTYLEKSEMDPDWLFLLMKIIRMVCQSEFKSNRYEILGKLCNSQILTIVWNYLGDVALETKESRVQNLPNFINDLSELYKYLINTMPSVAMEKDLRKTILKTKMAIENLNRHQKSVQIDEAVDKQLDMLLATYDDHLKVVQERLPKEKARSYLDRIADCAPPENFRELSLYPTYEDIARKNLGFVRPNKISGAYDNVEHYLDIQFRLLREDFIDPLRKGLHKYMQSKSETTKASKFKYDNVRLYPDTRFVQVKNSKSHHLGILLNFDPNGKMKKMKWDRSKRFMYGSLLMFTADDFHTFFFGTVLERNLNDLSTGKILVALTENARVCESFFKHPFLMAESEVFFNPYFLAMKLLKELDDSSFPMKKYIVEGKSTTEYPSYLTKFNSWSLDGRIVNPTDTEKWPSAIEMGLDLFQHRAFVAALTQDFCVIQGPPGTGKSIKNSQIF